MKSTTVETITSNEQHVRMRIFDGDLPANEAYQALWQLEREQRAAEWQRHLAYVDRMEMIIRELQAEINER